MSRSSIAGSSTTVASSAGATAGAADLLVVGDRGGGRAHVHDEAEGGVEAHAERAGRDQRLDPPGQQVLLEGLALGGLGLAGVRRDLVPARAQVVGDLLGGGDREAVDDAGAGLLGEVVGQPGQPLLGGLEPDHAEPERLAVERAAQDEDVGAELLGDVGGDPGVGGGGRGEDRDAVGQVAEQGADPAVVGPEVVAPVGDAVRLVDHEQAGGGREPRQHLVAEAGVVEPLGADQQHVDLAGQDRLLDRLPVLDVGGVDGDRADPGALGGERSGCASARAAATRSRSARRPARAAAGWPRSRPRTCPSRCAARRATRRRCTASASIADHWSSRSTASSLPTSARRCASALRRTSLSTSASLMSACLPATTPDAPIGLAPDGHTRRPTPGAGCQAGGA